MEGVSVREVLLNVALRVLHQRNSLCHCWGLQKGWGRCRKFIGVVIGFETFPISRSCLNFP